MHIIDSEEKLQKMINSWANENMFLKGQQCHTQIFFSIAVCIATVCISQTGEHSPWLGTVSVKALEFKVSRLT